MIFVASEKPYLVASDYSTITYKDDVYLRIEELPEYAYPTTMLGATIWEDSRKDGLSKWDQSMQDDKVQLFEDDEGREYLWLVEDYVDNVLGANENGEDKLGMKRKPLFWPCLRIEILFCVSIQTDIKNKNVCSYAIIYVESLNRFGYVFMWLYVLK